jgi:hypothetical protein
MNRLTAIASNGMLYKDITQWLRQRTFTLLFLGLLGFCEFIAVLLGTLQLDNPAQAGTITFGLLTGALALFGIVTAFNGHMATSREFSDKTFELYALAGMSLEKMVLGKLLSLMTQFLFGACCIVPFLFFAYLLGGVDFYAIITALVVALLVAPPIFLFSLLVAAYQKQRTTRILSRIGAVFGLIIFIQYFFIVILAPFAFGRGRSAFSASTIITDLLSGSADAWGMAALILCFYFQVCLLLFYICAHAMRPATDSREHLVKALLTSLFTCFALILVWNALMGRSMNGAYQPFFIVLYVLMAWLGMTCFFGPLTVPIIIRRRQQALAEHPTLRTLPARVVHFWFEPGPRGLFCTYLLLISIALGSAAVMWYCDLHSRPLNDDAKRFFTFLSYPLSMPFFIAFPAVLFYSFDRFARYKYTPALILLFWVVAGVVCQILFAVQVSDRHFLASVQQYLLLWCSIFLSPISTVSAETWARELNIEQTFYPIRFLLGLIGLAFMLRIIARRKKLNVTT